MTACPELIAFIKEGLGSIRTPKAIQLVDDLPRSAVGKVPRRNVKAQWDTDDRSTLEE